MSPYKTSNGYLNIKLCKDRKRHTFQIHRLVALAFISNPECKKEVNHKNSIKIDNKLENLEWATPKENSQHCIQNNPDELQRRKCNGLKFRKLSFEAAESIRKLYSTGNYSHRKLGSMFDIAKTSIGMILNNEIYNFKEA